MKHQKRKHLKHQKGRHLRTTIMFTIVGGAVVMNPAFAQDAQSTNQTATSAQQVSQQSANNQQSSVQQLGTITATGVRNSLEQSMNIKRFSVGVVDAISAEDIGKFPDTNLAASLQRITGVSISRRNGAGALVTVRGFGPQFNIVTLNGRHIPGADAFGAAGQLAIGNVGAGSRSFNFAQLSPNAVKALEVYKTGRANHPSGGIGATINIETARPFDYQGGEFIGQVSAKAMYDTSQPFDTDTTPAFSGTFSYANPGKTWGITLTANVQNRHTGDVESTVNYWNMYTWEGAASADVLRPGATVKNAPAIGQLYGIPNDIRYAFKEVETKRQNAHATFQLRPVDSLTLTLDYLYSKYRIEEDRGEQAIWLQKQITDITFDTDEPVATPVYLRDVPGFGGKDFGMEQQHYDQVFRLNNVGLNVAWDVSNDFRLSFDAHDSTAKSLPNDAFTGGGVTFISMAGTNNCTNGDQCGGNYAQVFHFNEGLPIGTRIWYPDPVSNALNGTGAHAVNAPFTFGEIGAQPLRINAQAQTTEIQEAKIDGDWDFGSGRFQFGASYQKTELHRTQAQTRNSQLGAWGVADAGAFPDLKNYIHEINLTDLFDDYNTDGVANSVWIGNADSLAQWATKHYPGASTKVSPKLAADNHVEEATKAVYAQVTLYGDLGGLPTTTRFGLRYQTTDVTSSSVVALPQPMLWLSNNDFQLNSSSTKKPFSADASYSNLLPNVDFNINFTNELKGRASYSKTIARVPYGNLYAGPGAGRAFGSTLISDAYRAGGSNNNPALKPLVSDNVDLGLGWYFAPSSYVSLTYWTKRVNNFLGSSVYQDTLYGLRDPTSGPRAQKALAFLSGETKVDGLTCAQTVAANGGTNPCEVSNTTLFSGVALQTYDPDGLAAYGRESAIDLEEKYDVTANPNDPLYVFNITHPVNQHTGNLHGWELGGQYFFGHSGFGISANYTLVNGDVHFDKTADPSENQFALTGLSDSGNAVLIYEKYGFSARLAYNWRGKYLSIANNGGSRNPVYVEPYQQYDLSLSYAITDHFSVFADAINLTGENIRWHARSPKQIIRLVDLKPRYALGVRYEF